MQIIASARQTGKTTAIIQAALASKARGETPVIVTHSMASAADLMGVPAAFGLRIYSCDVMKQSGGAVQTLLAGLHNVRLFVDNVDLVLRTLLGAPVAMASATAESMRVESLPKSEAKIRGARITRSFEPVECSASYKPINEISYGDMKFQGTWLGNATDDQQDCCGDAGDCNVPNDCCGTTGGSPLPQASIRPVQPQPGGSGPTYWPWGHVQGKPVDISAVTPVDAANVLAEPPVVPQEKKIKFREWL